MISYKAPQCQKFYSLTASLIVPSAEVDALKAIYAAIAANPNAETELTPETISKLERITIEWRTSYSGASQYFKNELEKNYKAWQKRLIDHIEALKKSENIQQYNLLNKI